MSDGTCTWRLRDTRCKYEVGDIIPKVGNPKDYEYLILADGSGFDAASYTELAKVFTDGKVPNLTDGRFLEGGVVAGKVKGEGLPNITGVASNYFDCGLIRTDKNPSVSGCFYEGGQTAWEINGDVKSDKGRKLNFDASRSNPIYGSSNTVQYYICYGG